MKIKLKSKKMQAVFRHKKAVLGVFVVGIYVVSGLVLHRNLALGQSRVITPVAPQVAQTQTQPASQSVAPAPVPVAPKPAPPKTAKPKPKKATNPAASPAAVSATKTSPGASATGLTQTATITPPASSSSDQSATPCINTPAKYASLNWAGYFRQGCTFTAVSGAWTVPTPTSTDTNNTSIDAAWIGIGGAFTQDLIQVGTEDAVESNGTIDSAVFYELLPDAPHYPSSIVVSPGDHVHASIQETSAGRWLISISNTTTGHSFTTTVSYNSSHSSVEWIEEDPSFASGGLVPFDDFGTVTFSASSATGNGTVGDLSDASSIKLVGGGHTLATPSLVSGGTNFSVTRSVF